MMSNEEKLERLHDISMTLLKHTGGVMKKTGCSYMLDAGTLLGAIRHKSFIPWDDDADICMLREDYNRFLKTAPELFYGDFEFVLPGQKGDNAFYDFVPKIIYKKAYIGRGSEDDKFYKGRYSHPALDIFVIDKVPDSNAGQRLHTMALILIYGLAMGHRRKIDRAKYSFLENAVITVMSFFGKMIPLYMISSLYDKTASMFENKNKSKVMSTHSAMDHFGDVYEYDWYKDVLRGDINGAKFPIPVGYDKILRKHYKDYMSLPPEDKRVPKHLDFCDIEFED